MNQTRVSVEWLSNEIKTYFNFASLESQMKTELNAVGKFTVYEPYFKMQKHVYMEIKFLFFFI